MTHPDTSPRLHAEHDPSLVAAFAAGDAAGRELAEAQTLVALCAECATLHRDLRDIAAALPAMPAPSRTHDFRITAEQAAELRPRGLARLLAPLASARFAFAGPAGAGLAAIGLAGILLSGGLGGTTMLTPVSAPVVQSGAGTNAPAFAAPPASPLDNGTVAGQAQPLPLASTTSGVVTNGAGADASAPPQPGASYPAGPKQATGSVERLESTAGNGAAQNGTVPAPEPSAATAAPMRPAEPAGIPPVTLVGALLLTLGLLLGGLRVLARSIA